jgi:competence protein ComEC
MSGDFSVPRIALLSGLTRRLEAEQERWFLWLPVMLGAGIGVYFALDQEPQLLTALAVGAVGLGVRALASRRTLPFLAATALMVGCAGFAIAKIRVEQVRAPVLAKAMHGVVVGGFIELIEPHGAHGQRLTLWTTKIGVLPPAERPVRVRVAVNKATEGLRSGDAITLRATLMRPASPALPGEYDFGRQAWFEKVGAVGYTRSGVHRDDDAGVAPISVRFWSGVERFRRAMGARITAVLPGETGAIADALITGERGGISNATNDAFRDSGLLHILSISGLHMAIVAGAVFYVVRFVLAGIPAFALRRPIKKWAAAAAMIAAFAYLLISGSAFATVRSAIMISIMFFAVLLDRPALALRNVGLAALMILLVFPESLYDVGFQMSFAAVLALVSAYEVLRVTGGWSRLHAMPGSWLLMFLAGIVLSTLIASAAVAPFAAYHFHKSQQYAVLANLIAIPACNLIVMPAALAAVLAMPFGLEAPPLWVMGWGIDLMVWTAKMVAALPGAVIRIPAISSAAFLAMIAGGLWLILWQQRWRLYGLVLIIAGVALAPTMRLPDVFVGRDGGLVAVRGEDGRLAAVGSARAFELQRWLEHDGDARPPKDAVRLAKEQAFRCDGIGCVARVKGVTLALARHPAAFADDCAAAEIVVSSIASPKACRRPAAVIDFFSVRHEGTHAIWIDPGGALRVETVAQSRGTRPWSPRWSPALPAPRPRPPPEASGSPADAAHGSGDDQESEDATFAPDAGSIEAP